MNKSFTIPILFFIALIIVVYFILPLFSDFSNLKNEFEKRKEVALTIENYYKDVHDNFNKLKEHQESLEKIDSALPNDSFLPSLFNYLQKTSAENGVFLKSVNLAAISGKTGAGETGETVGEEKVAKKFQEEYVGVELIGFYDGFKNFLKSVEKSSRLIEIEEVQISKEEKEVLSEGEGLSTLDLLLKVYSY
jgi:Tfp pilus assembly protein PilO